MNKPVNAPAEGFGSFTPKALHNTAQGRASAPWEKKRDRFIYPEGVAQSPFRPLYNPFGVVMGATLFSQGALARPWATL